MSINVTSIYRIEMVLNAAKPCNWPYWRHTDENWPLISELTLSDLEQNLNISNLSCNNENKKTEIYLSVGLCAPEGRRGQFVSGTGL